MSVTFQCSGYSQRQIKGLSAIICLVLLPDHCFTWTIKQAISNVFMLISWQEQVPPQTNKSINPVKLVRVCSVT